jgi:hypothetical protein
MIYYLFNRNKIHLGEVRMTFKIGKDDSLKNAPNAKIENVAGLV